MRILCVVPDFPWPTRVGTHLRSQQVIAALAGLGELDLFSLAYPNRPDPCALPDDVVVSRLEVVTNPLPVHSLWRRLRWLVARDRPLEVVAAESAAVRARFEAWADRSYDLVWVSRATVFDMLGRPRLGRTIVDLDDLEDKKIRGRLDAMRRQPAPVGRRAQIHRRAAMMQGRRNAARWTRLQKSVARSVDSVVLCSDDDRQGAGLPNAVVVPNGYEPPPRPLGRVEVGEPPVILFQGSMRYGPNTDGAVWFVTDIAPLIRRRLPEVRVRLVGDPDGVVTGLDHRPEVTVVGHVPSMDVELAGSDLVVAPLRYASGTRLKILEALAHRIPVVSTTVGAEGLGLEGGRHLLLADDAQAFADACVSALTEPELRRTLVDEGEAAFLQNHQWSQARARVQALALAEAAPAPSGTAGLS
jgi:glycosyltransferase involved in cell wall biosynthesis